MAILKSYLEEDLFSKQERVILRNVTHALQLSEGIRALRTIRDIGFSGDEPGLNRAIEVSLTEQYLLDQITKCISSIRIPNSKPAVDKEISTPD